ncbi:MAG: AMP-binding protein [Acidiferrobacterales bacterium]|nr:AMP-binding protein [Acidiferrobacterales bacterium]
MKKNFNLFAHFEPNFKEHADKELLLTLDGQSFSYADIDHQSARLARCLSDLGVKIGDRISVQVSKSTAAFALYLACLRGGFVFHPLNTGYRSSELDYFFSNAQPTLIVCDQQSKELIDGLATKYDIPHVLTLNADGQGSLIEQAKLSSDSPVLVTRDKDDMAALLYSSGTTGVPKGIMLSHGNLLSNTESLIKAWGFSDQDRLLHALPIFHVHGLFVALGCVLMSGANMVWLDAFNPEDTIASLPSCSVMMGVPTFYTRLLANPSFSKQVCENMRLFISGSAPLLEETFNNFKEKTGHQILERYGMTETNMNTSNPLNGVRKAGTVGLALPGVEIRIVDEANKPLANNKIGDLQVKGDNVFVGYWQMPEKTAADFTEDGYFNTGDKGLIDDQGYISIVGRSKDLVITGGLNVYPKEVELVIDDMPGVIESAVIGVPHPDFGEAVVAVVVIDQTGIKESEIIALARKKLASFKTPKSVQFVEELPRNTMSKVQKIKLRDNYQHLFQS